MKTQDFIGAFVKGVCALNGNQIERHNQRITLAYNAEEFATLTDEDWLSLMATVGSVFARRIPDAKFAPEPTVVKWVTERGNTYTGTDLAKYRLGARAARASTAVRDLEYFMNEVAKDLFRSRKDVQERIKVKAGNGGLTIDELFDTPAFEEWVIDKVASKPAFQAQAQERMDKWVEAQGKKAEKKQLFANAEV